MRNHGKQNERSHRLDNQSTAVKAPVEQPSANENTNVQVQPRHINRNEAHAPLQKNTLLLTDFFCYSKNTSIRDFQNSIADLAVSITENTKSKEDGGNEDTVFETKKGCTNIRKTHMKRHRQLQRIHVCFCCHSTFLCLCIYACPQKN